MTEQPQRITLYFDFLCPFAYRVSCWLDNVQEQVGTGLHIDWKYFSLEQNLMSETEGWHLWEQPEDYPDVTGRGQHTRALLAFWGAEAARRQGIDAFHRFRQALYHARHHDELDMSQRPNIELVARQVGLDMEQFRHAFADRSLLNTLRHNHEEARTRHDIFGVPTICFDDDNRIFLKLMQVPPPEESLPLFKELHTSFTNWRWLAEIKRPNPGPLA